MTTCFRPRIAVTIGALIATAVMLAACNSTPSSTGTSSTTPSGATSSTAGAAPVNVVASTNFWGDIAKQVGGDRLSFCENITLMKKSIGITARPRCAW